MDNNGRGETAADGYGVTLYDAEGKRTGLKAVELRFKRLDWGMWIRPRAGRDKKKWNFSFVVVSKENITLYKDTQGIRSDTPQLKYVK